MKIEEIRLGSFVNLKLLVPEKYPAIRNDDGIKGIVIETPTGKSFIVWEDDFEALSPANGTKNTEPAPKYDPCRLFRKGDKVRIVMNKGRHFNEDAERMCYCYGIVTFDERKGEYVDVSVTYGTSEEDIEIDPAYLELVTPVEEQERYILIHNENEKYYEVCWKDDDEPDGRTGRTRCRATYWYHLPPQTYSQKEAKAAAEAERDRLNAEYRKEQSNG